MIVLNRCICPLLRIHQSRSYGTAANQISKAMKKFSIIGKKTHKKTKWHDAVVPVRTVPTCSIAPKRETSKQGLRRLSVLNKLFMRYITDMMATGEVCPELLGKGIQITGVRVTPDFHKVNVLWVGNGTVSEQEIEKSLETAGYKIKHELSKLRVMGVVPFITFVKDKKAGLVNRVEELLQIADYPEDYTPSMTYERLKDETQLYNSLSSDLIKKIKELDAAREDDFEEEPLPEMQHNVFGLDQGELMRKIGSEKDKIRAAWEEYEIKKSSPNVEKLIIDQKTTEEAKENFKNYLESKEFKKKIRKPIKSIPFDPYVDKIVEEVDEEIYFKDGDYLDEEEYDPRKD